MSKFQLKTARSRDTREKLVRLAREGFVRQGFDGLSTEGLVDRAGVTRGALYHHFRDKRDLFEAVLTGIEESICVAIEARIGSRSGNPWDRLVGTCQAILGALADPDVQTVLIVDGKAVLGRADWWRIHRQHVFRSLGVGVSGAIEGGYLPSQPSEPLTHVLWGALSEAGDMMAYSGGAGAPVVASGEVTACVLWLLHSLAD
jgi:AcrR family transcriptional regulator